MMLLHGMYSGATFVFVSTACLVFRFELSSKDGRKCKLKETTTTITTATQKLGLLAVGLEGSENIITWYGFFNMHTFILLLGCQEEHVSKRKRHLSISKESDLQEADYYDDVKPQPLSPLKRQPKLPQTFQDSSAGAYKKQISVREFEMPLLGNIVLEGHFMAASEMYGCFMTMSGGLCLNTRLPDNFRVSLCTALRMLAW